MAIRYAYEWEGPVDSQEEKKIAARQIYRLREEIKRITTTTLRGNFTKPEDRQYWVDRLKVLNGQLIYWEEECPGV